MNAARGRTVGVFWSWRLELVCVCVRGGGGLAIVVKECVCMHILEARTGYGALSRVGGRSTRLPVNTGKFKQMKTQGLGKTVQAIAFLAGLKYSHIDGKHPGGVPLHKGDLHQVYTVYLIEDSTSSPVVLSIHMCVCLSVCAFRAHVRGWALPPKEKGQERISFRSHLCCTYQNLHYRFPPYIT